MACEYHPWWDDRRDSVYEHDPHCGAVSDKHIHTSSLPAAVLLEVDTTQTNKQTNIRIKMVGTFKRKIEASLVTPLLIK